MEVQQPVATTVDTIWTDQEAFDLQSIVSGGNLCHQLPCHCRSTWKHYVSAEAPLVVCLCLTTEAVFLFISSIHTSSQRPSRVLIGAGPGSIRPFSQGFIGIANGSSEGVQCSMSGDVA